MGNKRMIHDTFFESEDVSEWTLRQRLLVIGIIALADDQGRVRAHPRWLKSKIFPYDDIPSSEIESDLESITSTNDTLIIYETEGKQYIQLKNWWEYQSLQWAKPSDYPAPEGWTDRIRMMIYEPERWVMTLNWSGSDDRTDYQAITLPNKPPDGGDDALPLINTNTTPKLDSDSIEAVDEEAGPTKFSELSVAFVNETRIPEFTAGPKAWIDSTERMVRAGVEPEDVIKAIHDLRAKNYKIVRIASIENAAISAMSERKTGNRNGRAQSSARLSADEMLAILEANESDGDE